MIDLKQNWSEIRIVSHPDMADDQSVMLEEIYQAFKARMIDEERARILEVLRSQKGGD